MILNYQILFHIKITFYLSGPVITCTGNTGHGSVIVDNTAANKATNVLNKFMAWRQREKDKLDADPNLNLSDVTTVNLTTIKVSVTFFYIGFSHLLLYP